LAKTNTLMHWRGPEQIPWKWRAVDGGLIFVDPAPRDERALRDWLELAKPGAFQRSRAGFKWSRPTGEMHPQAIALFGAFEALPAKVVVFDNKGGSRIRSREAPAIRKRMHNRDNQMPAGRSTRLISFTVAGTSSTSINTL
jgi:hypothetical protein